MIIMDYNGIAIGNIMINKENDEDMIRHMILNTICMYKVKFQKEYGDVVVACDGMNNCCLLYTSPSPRDRTRSRMPSSA